MNRKLDIYYDDKCKLCSSVKQHLVEGKNGRNLQFIPLEDLNLPEDHPEKTKLLKTDSILVSEEGKWYTEGDAVLTILRQGGMINRFLGFLIGLFPRRFRNAVYRYIARKRKRWFGRIES